MSITYYAGDFMFGGTGDAKPTGLMPGARYLEKETLIEFVLTGNKTWVERGSPYSEYTYVLGTQLVSGQLVGIPNGKTYIPRTGHLQVYVNGELQRPGTGLAANNENHWDYRETNSTGITFNYAIGTGAMIEFIKIR